LARSMFNQQLSGDIKELEDLIRDYGSKLEDFDRLFANSLSKHKQQEDRLWDDRQNLLKHIEPDEWQAIMQCAMVEQEKEAAKKENK